MRALVLVSASVLGLGALTACSRPAPPPTPTPQAGAEASQDALIAKAKYRVTHDFHDPLSAQFREITLFHVGARTNVCGEVNGKNLEGAYVGFELFAYDSSTDQAMTYSADTADAYRTFSTATCRNVSQAQIEQENRTAQAAEDAKHHETPLPYGYNVIGVVPYADTTVDKEAEEAVQRLRDDGNLDAEIDGTRVSLVASQVTV